MADEPSKEVMESALEAIEVARSTGKIRKGTNETTKALEKGKAKLVVYAKNAQPPEIVMHIPLLSKEKGVPCIAVASKEDLGAAAGISKGAASVAIVEEGESKDIIKDIASKFKA